MAAYCISDEFSESVMGSGVLISGGGGFHHLERAAAEPIGALWVRLRMGLLCSCASRREITRDKAMKMATRATEMDAAARDPVSFFFFFLLEGRHVLTTPNIPSELEVNFISIF